MPEKFGIATFLDPPVTRVRWISVYRPSKNALLTGFPRPARLALFSVRLKASLLSDEMSHWKNENGFIIMPPCDCFRVTNSQETHLDIFLSGSYHRRMEQK